MKIYNSVIPTLNEIKLRDFQYKITNKILVTKSFLYRINKVDDNLCEYCRQNPETIHHLFVHCNTVKIFWRELEEWLINNFNLRISLNGQKYLVFLRTKTYTDKLYTSISKILCILKQIFRKTTKHRIFQVNFTQKIQE